MKVSKLYQLPVKRDEPKSFSSSSIWGRSPKCPCDKIFTVKNELLRVYVLRFFKPRWASGKVSASEPRSPGSKLDSTEDRPAAGMVLYNPPRPGLPHWV
ncbi:hypothetical protein AVEN_181948-1 [Araneus ventricosus]|uniref:Uncharacterized protein n=1 Tax=Araneus ventricosus TaxID=182803 RepID=A0A4Y2UMG6_ARAVE|nr:hypothetical protein AVEN_181948-1 [Araneus ventricosus]